jgi:hypothetical protein
VWHGVFRSLASILAMNALFTIVQGSRF